MEEELKPDSEISPAEALSRWIKYIELLALIDARNKQKEKALKDKSA